MQLSVGVEGVLEVSLDEEELDSVELACEVALEELAELDSERLELELLLALEVLDDDAPASILILGGPFGASQAKFLVLE